MMGHVWKRDGRTIIAAKGSPEKILALCGLADQALDTVRTHLGEMSRQGLRVIAVGRQILADGETVPPGLSACSLQLCGLVGLADPPRETIKEDIRRCVRAGIRVVMITGDNGVTASSIARQIGMPGCEKITTGDELDQMTDEALCENVRETNIFSRVVPAHKMHIVKALKEHGEVVAMTGDGVNDAPALKYADIGIAMGKRGSQVSREAADLILLDDRFTTIVDTIGDGRRIYDNIRKAVGYVFTIHIPIALSCLLAPMLGINPASLFLLPLHVVLLELIIDPTCSIVLERQPAEQNIMARGPRDPYEKIIGAKGLLKSVLQGLAVFAASFGVYAAVLQSDPAHHAPTARAMGLAILFISNMLLVQVNSSDRDAVFVTAKRLMRDRVMWATMVGTIAGLALVLYSPLSGFLKLSPLSGVQILVVLGISAAAVLWYELVKLFLRHR
ncbi:MAG: cation-translocating P-type ATPase, partial [Ethanoligenens sp.]